MVSVTYSRRFTVHMFYSLRRRCFLQGLRFPRCKMHMFINVVMLGDVPQSTELQRLVIAWRHRFWRKKSIFVEGGKQGNPEKTRQSESDWDQPITAHVRAQDRTRVAVVGGEDDDHCAKQTTRKKLKNNSVRFNIVLLIDPFNQNVKL